MPIKTDYNEHIIYFREKMSGKEYIYIVVYGLIVIYDRDNKRRKRGSYVWVVGYEEPETKRVGWGFPDLFVCLVGELDMCRNDNIVHRPF